VTTPLEDAAAAAARGELVVFPTDTVYGIGARPDDPSATARLFEAKRRPRELELPVLVAAAEQADVVGVLDEPARRLASAYWPGPLTLVVRRAPAAVGWELGGDPDTVGVRVPRHPLARALLQRTGPLATTSANRSGEPTPTDLDGVERAFGDLVAVYLGQDAPLAGAPSTVLDLTSSPPAVLRAGAIAERELAPYLA